jgi:hypothetical protein
MNLIELSAEAGRVTGKGLGFVVKSIAHPERKYKVEALLGNGEFVITRLGDGGKSYFVGGDQDRYDFSIPMARVSDLIAEKATLTERLSVVTSELSTLGAVG